MYRLIASGIKVIILNRKVRSDNVMHVREIRHVTISLIGQKQRLSYAMEVDYTWNFRNLLENCLIISKCQEETLMEKFILIITGKFIILDKSLNFDKALHPLFFKDFVKLWAWFFFRAALIG